MKAVSRITLSAAYITYAVLTSSCATIESGTTQRLKFSSAPDGASVLLNGRLLGTTPFEADIQRRSPGIITIQKFGFDTNVVRLSKAINSITYKNAALLPFYEIGNSIDRLSGARYTFKKNQIHIQLTPSEVSQ